MVQARVLYSDSGLQRAVKHDLFICLAHCQVDRAVEWDAIACLCFRILLNLERAGAIPKDWKYGGPMINEGEFLVAEEEVSRDFRDGDEQP